MRDRGLRLLASLVAGDDPAALALAEALRARGDARRALDAAERTRGVVAAMLREGVAAQDAVAARAAAVFAGERPLSVEGNPVAPVCVGRARELLRDLAGEG